MIDRKLDVIVILGSTREGRYGDKPARWICDRLAEHPDIAPELVDLRDWPLPLFDQPRPPGRVSDGEYGHPVANRWAARIGRADGFVITAAEYNHGYTAVLKNALDWVYREWSRKPVAFLGYGGAGGARAIEQLRQVVIELEMAPIRYAIHLPREVFMATVKQPLPVDPTLFAPAEAAAKAMTADLVWWAHALRRARTV